MSYDFLIGAFFLALIYAALSFACVAISVLLTRLVRHYSYDHDADRRVASFKPRA